VFDILDRAEPVKKKARPGRVWLKAFSIEAVVRFECRSLDVFN
jgi:hypothetical protein